MTLGGHAIDKPPMPSRQNHRRQLTLFVTGAWAPGLDKLRRVLDPVQAALIAAHVTLCREDEIASSTPDDLFRRLASWSAGPLTLVFGRPVRFNGHGVLLPCEQGCADFQRLRQWLLQPQTAREHAAHITLAHPRNPRSAGNTDAALAACPDLPSLQFGTLALIEQQGAGAWTRLAEARLASRQDGVA